MSLPIYTAFALDVKENTILVGSAGRHMRTYDLRYLSSSPTIPTPPTNLVTESPLEYQTRCVKLFPDLSGIAVGSIEGRVGVEYFADDARNATPKSAQTTLNDINISLDLTANAKKNKFAFRCHRETIKIGEKEEVLIYPVNAISFYQKSGSGIFATCGGDGFVSIWDAKNKKKMSQFGKYHTTISSIDFSVDGKKLAIAASYTYDHLGKKLEGENNIGKEQIQIPGDKLIIRDIKDEDVKPKEKHKR